MSCFAPVIAWYRKEVIDGKRQITFNRAQAHFPAPLHLPCGKCIGCLQARGRQWAIRCEHERKLHNENCFVTLTYDQASLPKGHTLVKRDLQNFMKRLRKNIEPRKVRFYACGEYGEKTARPHYHILLFGWSEQRENRKLLRDPNGRNPTYNSTTISRCWPNGHAVVGDVTLASCLYVAGYIAKNYGRERELDIICGDGEVIRRQKPFALMSRQPGIGAGYVDKYQNELIAHDNVIVDGNECRIPRYYDNQLVKKEYQTQEKLQDIKISRRREMRVYRKDNTRERLHVREKFEHLKMQAFKKGEI